MTERERNRLLKQSFDYISGNFDSTFDKIPRNLRQAWYFDPKQDDEEQYQFAWTIFTYVFTTSKRLDGIFEFSESEEQLSKLFSNWQVSLILAELNDVTDLEIEPFNIFHIEKLETTIVQVTSG